MSPDKPHAMHPARLPEEVLLKSCTLTTGRSGGPGGQHRNKVATMVRIQHDPTGIACSAGERRRQFENRRNAIHRLRVRLAIQVRSPGSPPSQPSRLWSQRRQGRSIPVNPRHQDYPALLSEALDVVCARSFDVARAAGALDVSMSQLARLIRHDKHAFGMVNEGRVSRHLPPLR